MMDTPDTAAAGSGTFPYMEEDEARLAAAFLEKGYVILEAEDGAALADIRATLATAAARHLGGSAPDDHGVFLNGIHAQVPVSGLNPFRLACIQALNEASWVRPAYFRLARRALSAIVGNELAMQRNVNLSIQMPDDVSSLLPMHADVWDGDSPYEVVLWVPLVDCFRTKSMYILPRAANEAAQRDLARFQFGSVEDVFRAVEPDLEWLDIRFGQVLIFSQNLMHGNTVNGEHETRWTMNCRFKSLLSPYAGKELGAFFEPITMRPATKLGLHYRHPGGFTE